MATLASSERKWTTNATEDNLLQGDAGERKWDPRKVACPWKIGKICRQVFKGVNLPCKSIYDVYIYICIDIYLYILTKKCRCFYSWTRFFNVAIKRGSKLIWTPFLARVSRMNELETTRLSRDQTYILMSSTWTSTKPQKQINEMRKNVLWN